MLGLWLAIIATAAPPELADQAELPEGEEVMLTAENLLHDGKRDLTTAEGDAKLTSEGIAVDADRIVYDQPRNVATAVGHVVARIVRTGKIAVTGDVLTIILDEHRKVQELYIYDGRAVSKKDVSNEKFLAANTVEQLEKTGTTNAILQGNHLTRETNGWRVEELELVPCECDFAHPSWSITSSSAVVDTENDRVSITNPVVRVKSVPILWLPWLSLPMTNRQTGLLFPKPGYSALNGFSLDVPVFITAGRSYDFTLTPGFFTGAPIINGVQNPTGVQGPRLNTEFRYAPEKRTSGKVVLGLLYDFRTQRAVDLGIADRGTGPRGLRGEFSWLHVEDFDFGFGARADISAHSDGDYNRDLTVDVIASATTYLRSSAKVFQKGDTHYVGLDVGLRQDIQWGYDWLGRQHLAADTTVAKFGPGTLQRLPALTFGWQPENQLGPVRFEVEGDIVRLSPLFSKTGDEGVNANGGAIMPTAFATGVASFFAPRNGVTGVGDRIWQPGERESRLRLMAKPTVSVSLQPGGVMSATMSASWRQYMWAGEASGLLWHRGYLLLDGKVETELSRRFGSFHHVIQPMIDVRALPFGVQSAQPIIPYDAVDAAVPNLLARVQGIAELRQRLLRNGAELIRLSVGQGLEFSGPKMQATPGEFYASLAARYGWFALSGQLRFDPQPKRYASNLTAVDPGNITRSSARLDIDDGRGHGLFASYDKVLLEGTMRSRQPIDLLFLVDRGYTSATPVQMITAGAKWNFGPVFVHYDVLISDQRPLVGTGAAAVPDPNAPLRLTFQQHALGVGFAPACDCWRVDFTATQPLYPRPVVPLFALNVTVARFGSIGVSSPR